MQCFRHLPSMNARLMSCCLLRLHHLSALRAENYSKRSDTAHIKHLRQPEHHLYGHMRSYRSSNGHVAGRDDKSGRGEAPRCLRRFVYLCKAAARLEMALCNYAFQKVISKGYTPVCTPDLVRASLLQRCGFQPRAENTQVRQSALSQPGPGTGRMVRAGWQE